MDKKGYGKKSLLTPDQIRLRIGADRLPELGVGYVISDKDLSRINGNGVGFEPVFTQDSGRYTIFKLCGIRISGPALGRPKKDSRADKKIEYRDAVDRIEVERAFSLAKRSFGLGLITTKLETTTRSSIVLSIIAMNVDRLTKEAMRFLLSIFQGTYVGLSFEPTFLTMVY